MTGAKLLGMHETVPSPTEYRSHPRGSPQVMPASCSGAMRTTLGFKPFGGNLPANTAASVSASRTVAKRAMLEGETFQGLNCYPS